MNGRNITQVGDTRLVWRIFTAEPSDVETSIIVEPMAGGHRVVAELAVGRAANVAAVVEVQGPQQFAVAMYHAGVTQQMGEPPMWASSTTPLRRFYTVGQTADAMTVIPHGEVCALTQWGAGGALVSLVGMGTVNPSDGTREGHLDLATALEREPLMPGITMRVEFTLQHGAAPVMDPEPGAVELPEEQHRSARSLALWGSTVPALGTLDVPGSAYPTINLPRRTYGERHTFFDPDAWSVCAALSWSGVPDLQQESRNVIELSLSHIRDDGLIPHHFEGREPDYVAISGSPQPGPNIFLLEAAIDHACATGDFAWLADRWEQGLRHATRWLLDQLDVEHGLLYVVGALWVDVFRRQGFTLDTNAMVVRTFSRVAQLARLLDDPLAAELETAAQTVRENLQWLWHEDHFVTSRGRGDEPDDDHLDTENYLAIAVGAATPEQSRRIFTLFDASHLTHPGRRGTGVSLRRYEAADCYLGNTGDSDTAMARHFWVDLMARHAVGDRDGFMELYTAVHEDLLRLIWMRERYDRQGRMIRAEGYHEYPEILDMVTRECIYGLQVDVLRVRLQPLLQEPFSVRYGDVRVAYAPERIYLRIPGAQQRAVEVHGLPPSATFVGGGLEAGTDPHGVLRFSAALADGVELRRQD